MNGPPPHGAISLNKGRNPGYTILIDREVQS